jgi:predicted metalloenzyme YecM
MQEIENIIGDYGAFFADLRRRIERTGIDITGYPVSHVAFRTETHDEYLEVRDCLRAFCLSDVENVWNGRPIDKLLLRDPLALGDDFRTSLIELIPPVYRQEYPMGLEHAGIVIGATFDEFIEQHRPLFTGQQDQGPYCQPVYITFDNDRTVKFYRYSLRDVVEKEGRRFIPR